jgi:hypothetical protein
MTRERIMEPVVNVIITFRHGADVRAKIVMLEQSRAEAEIAEADVGITGQYRIESVQQTVGDSQAIVWKNVDGVITVLDATHRDTETDGSEWNTEGLEDWTVGANV